MRNIWSQVRVDNATPMERQEAPMKKKHVMRMNPLYNKVLQGLHLTLIFCLVYAKELRAYRWNVPICNS